MVECNTVRCLLLLWRAQMLTKSCSGSGDSAQIRPTLAKRPPEANPHVWQRIGLEPGAHPELDRLPLEAALRADAPRRAYRRRQLEPKTAIHWGQRKLFIAELELLTEAFADLAGEVGLGRVPCRRVASNAAPRIADAGASARAMGPGDAPARRRVPWAVPSCSSCVGRPSQCGRCHSV